VLSEVAAGAATGDKDDDMDEPSPAVERTLGFGNIQGSTGTPGCSASTCPSSRTDCSSICAVISGHFRGTTFPRLRCRPVHTNTSRTVETGSPCSTFSTASPTSPIRPYRFVRSVIKSAIDEMAAVGSPRMRVILYPPYERTWASHDVVFLANISPLKIYYPAISKSLRYSNKKKS